MRVLRTVVVSLGVAASGHAAEIAPGAVVSGDGRAVYLRVERGGLEARAVGQGGVLWRSADDLRPLAETGGRLLCQRAAGEGRLDLLFLDAASGRPLAATTFALPEGVSSPLDEALGARFDLRAASDGPRALLVWRFERRPVRGAHFEEEHGQDGDDVLLAEGAVAVDVAEARATAAPVPAPEMGPLRVGAYRVAVVRTGDRLSLDRRTVSGASLPPVALPDGAVLQLGSADGRHVLVSRELPGAPLAGAHEWSVMALDTGSVVATLRTSAAAAPFAVAGGRVLLVLEAWGFRVGAEWREEPRRLEAFDPTGGAAWTAALADPRYRGPVAP